MKPKSKQAATGTRPEGTLDEAEAARQVREMFGAIAPRYDFLNHLLSFSCDRWWRWRTARRVRRVLRPGARALDLCCGTGDLTFAIESEARGKAGERAEIYGGDFVHGMLTRAREKAARRGSRARFLALDALRLPFAAESFDLVAMAFGFRNLANYRAGMQEFLRVLRPGGLLAILEFSEPRSRFYGKMYRSYFEKLLPTIGGAISGSRKAYGYLPASVARFPAPRELAAQLSETGFRKVSYECWMGGIVALHLAERDAKGDAVSARDPKR